ncbi:MAG: hypothetical protein ACREFP_00710, partial [Acetobacteraceae bacterium]
LYGIGARLDTQPELLFTLRKVDATDLVARAADGLPLPSKGPVTGRVLEDSKLSELFGIEMADVELGSGVEAPRPGRARRGPSVRKPARKPGRSGIRKVTAAKRAAGRTR